MRLSTNSISWAITWPKSLALKAQFKCFTHRMTLITESHHLSQLSRNCFSVQEGGETLPNRQLRVLLMYTIAFHSWWLRHRYTETHNNASAHTRTHTQTHIACTCGGSSFINTSSVSWSTSVLCFTCINTDTDSNQPSVSLSSFHLHKIFIDSWICPRLNLGKPWAPLVTKTILSE